MNDLIVGNLGLVHFVIKKMNISNLNEYDEQKKFEEGY